MRCEPGLRLLNAREAKAEAMEMGFRTKPPPAAGSARPLSAFSMGCDYEVLYRGHQPALAEQEFGQE